MAITKTVSIKKITYMAATSQPSDPITEAEHLVVEEEVVLSDPDDAHLPMKSTNTIRLFRGNDVSQQDTKVQTIFNALLK